MSVIVPARRCAPALRRCLEALAASDLPRSHWELIVVDDGSGDDTPTVAAEHADRVVRLTGPARGPAYARNRGAEAARGDILVFVDADVCALPSVLSRFAACFDADPGIHAAFGAYDTAPDARGFVSQYRNLVHHYVHSINAGDASTFWAGCGAVRAATFRAVGMYDEARYPRPQIEDIELGYRLSAAGFRIVLRADIQGRHLKQWTFLRMLATDFADRGVPWTRLLLERRGASGGGELNLRWPEKVYTALVGVAAIACAAAAATREARWLAVAVLALSVVALGNGPLLLWFARHKGWLFAARVVPLRFAYYALNGACAAWGTVLHYREHASRARPVTGRPAVRHGRG